MQKQKPAEWAQYWTSRRIRGLELLRARYLRHSFSRHYHEGYALGVIRHGALRFRFLGRDHVAAAGSVNLVVPGEVHDGHGADDRGWAYRMFYMPPELLLRAADEAGAAHGVLPGFTRGVLHDAVLAAALHSLHADMEREGADMPSLEQETRLTALLVRWVRLHGGSICRMPAAGSEPQAVRRAREFLDAHYAEDVRLEVLAAHACLSPFHLSRVFHAAMGMPPHAYLLQTRVHNARALLDAGVPTVEVALRTGFADQSHLTRQFKKQLGIPPGQYRKIIQAT